MQKHAVGGGHFSKVLFLFIVSLEGKHASESSIGGVNL